MGCVCVTAAHACVDVHTRAPINRTAPKPELSFVDMYNNQELCTKSSDGAGACGSMAVFNDFF